LLRRKDRERSRRFLAEGPQAVREAIGAAAVEVLLVDEATRERHVDLIEAALARGIEVGAARSGELADLTETVTPQGVLAVCRFPEVSESAVWAQRPRLVVACADVRDPGNAGTVLRCADAFGADAVLLSRASVDPYNPKAVRASVGSVFHLPVITGLDLGALTSAARGAGLQVLAADGAGEAELPELERSGSLSRPALWLFGNEAWGLSPDVAALADVRVRVPLYGAAESLNLAAAAAVCLYATATAQQEAAPRTAKPVAPGDGRYLD
jgi:TrmH family RNA methyltransferase